jgi:DNA-binding XRE family transcriptional regulator
MSQEEVAKEFNVSRQYIQQLEKLALKKFKIRFCALYPDTWKLIRDDIGRGHF